MTKNTKSQIRIGIDARFFGPKQKGLGRYVQKLVENLEKASRSDLFDTPFCKRVYQKGLTLEFVIFLRKENWHEYKSNNPNFKKVLADYQWYGLKEQIFMPFKIYQTKIDLMHFPHFNVPIFYFKPFIITIHDLILKRFSTSRASTLSPFLYLLKNLAYKIVIFSAVKRAKKIIAVSNYTKNDILKYFKIKNVKIKVVYEGVSLQSRPRLETYNLCKGCMFQGTALSSYLLYVGNAYPHKNLERLILAFAKIVNNKQRTTNNKYSNLQLVLVGELDYFYKRLKNFVINSKLQIQDSVIFADFVPDKKLITLYQNASAYVFPSLYEGFGLPPLEAMAHGLPVVCSNSSCLPEILGKSAVYFNPKNVNDMAKKIQQVLEDEKLQKKIINHGFKVIKKYSWFKMAQEIMKVYSL